MYCKKCGKEIADSAKFCRYCGTPIDFKEQDPVESQEDMANFEDVDDVKVVKHANRKKWIVSVCIAASVVVLAGTGVLAMNMSKVKKEDTKKAEQVKKEEDKKAESADKENANPEITYPKDIALDTDTMNSITDFITLLGNTDCKMDGLNSEQGEAYCGYAFLYMSVYKSVPFLNGSPVEIQKGGSYAYKIPETDVVNYLKNSIGKTEYLIDTDKEYSNIVLDEDMVCLRGFDPNSMWTVDPPVISKITAISKNEIEVQGSIAYNNIESGQIKNDIVIVLTANPDSIWGGYTLKSVNKWEEVSHYILPDVAIRNYAKDELKALDAHDLYLARNEIYARHGYMFNNQDLKDYFGRMSWYTPTVTEVPDTDFNEYEKANLALIQAREAELAQQAAELAQKKEIDDLYEEVKGKFAYTEQKIEYLEQTNQFAIYSKTEKLIINSVYTEDSKVCVDIELGGNPDTFIAYKINDNLVLASEIGNGQKTTGVRYGRSYSSEEKVFEIVYVYKDNNGMLSCERAQQYE